MIIGKNNEFSQKALHAAAGKQRQILKTAYANRHLIMLIFRAAA